VGPARGSDPRSRIPPYLNAQRDHCHQTPAGIAQVGQIAIRAGADLGVTGLTEATIPDRGLQPQGTAMLLAIAIICRALPLRSSSLLAQSHPKYARRLHKHLGPTMRTDPCVWIARRPEELGTLVMDIIAGSTSGFQAERFGCLKSKVED